MPEIELLRTLLTAIGTLARDMPDAARHRRLHGDGGYTTEAVIVIAGLAALALAVLVIIVKKVTDAANKIPTQ